MADVSTVTSLLPFQQEALEDLYRRTQEQVATPLPIFQGTRVAPMQPAQTQAIQDAISYATGPRAGEAINTAIDANTFWADPSRIFNLGEVPGYGATRQGIEQSVGRLLTEQALPSIRRGAVLNNQLGGSRQGIAEGLATGRSADALAAQLGNLDLGVFTQLLAANQNAIKNAPALTAAGVIPANLAAQAAAMLQTQEQAEIDAERQKFEEEANAPYFALDQLRASLGAFPGGTGATTREEEGAGWLETLASLALLGKSLSTPSGSTQFPLPTFDFDFDFGD